jgi:hypothetical protein
LYFFLIFCEEIEKIEKREKGRGMEGGRERVQVRESDIHTERGRKSERHHLLSASASASASASGPCRRDHLRRRHHRAPLSASASANASLRERESE